MRLTLLIAVTAFGATPLLAAAPITGKWLTQNGKGNVDIVQCGATICGKISKLSTVTTGTPKDHLNPDPALRDRPILGLPILTGLKDTGKAWEGRVYDPEHGKLYRAYVSRNANGTLSMKGCIAAFLCKTQTWKPL
jgi:uncharacterized protein (DUF2147 family)